MIPADVVREVARKHGWVLKERTSDDKLLRFFNGSRQRLTFVVSGPDRVVGHRSEEIAVFDLKRPDSVARLTEFMAG